MEYSCINYRYDNESEARLQQALNDRWVVRSISEQRVAAAAAPACNLSQYGFNTLVRGHALIILERVKDGSK